MIAPPPTEGPLLVEELQLATRNKGMPLEALRYDVTPVGLHYLLVHFDIPALDPLGWRLNLGGNVRRPLSLTLDDIRGRPRRTMLVTLDERPAVHLVGKQDLRARRLLDRAATRGPVAAAGSRLVWNDARQVAGSHRGLGPTVRRLPAEHRVLVQERPRRPG
jgi:DMSO/TMAO reductase YedYZ molybdopterin-dependent catalytic subunit